MTGAPATAGIKLGNSFTAHDGYAFGNNIELVPFSKIVQSWRTTDFSDDEQDSLIEVAFEDKENHTLITLTHSNLPPHGMTYKQGWIDYYFRPMQGYFSNEDKRT